uniref:RNA terminal phosphate cyclase like 1 n=1 Tax=Lynx canadensis TaxID=61383 RepID=A0A667H3Q0_LYNCA
EIQRGSRPRSGGEAGCRSPTPPLSPLTRCLVSPSSCSKPRGRAGGCGATRESPGHHRRCRRRRRGRDPRARPKSLRPSRRHLCRGRAHGDPVALPQLRGLQLLAPTTGPVHPEWAPRQNPKDSGQRRQPGPPRSPGFGLSLVAETTTGAFLSAELASNPQGQGAAVLPEDLGQNCAKLLLEEIYRGGCVDSTNQSLGLLLMTLGQQDVSKVLLGPLSPYTIEFLRHLKSFFQIMFKIETKPCGEELKGGDKVLLTCVGVGFSNLSKTLK